MAVLLLFILILNIVSIVLMYYCLGDVEKKEKFIFIAVGTGIMYILTSLVYWISTMKIEVTEVSETGKNLITFLFVPVNGLIILPILAKSYAKLKFGSLSNRVFANRVIVLAILLIIVLIFECIYFKGIQEQVVDLIKANSKVEQEEKDTNQLNEASQTNEMANAVDENSLNAVENRISEVVVNETNQLNGVSKTNEVSNATGGNENVVMINTLEE